MTNHSIARRACAQGTLLSLVAMMIVASCGGADSTSGDNSVCTAPVVGVTPSPPSMLVGATTDLTAVYDGSCRAGETTWTSSDPTIVNLQSTAPALSVRVVGLMPGTAVLTASNESRRDTNHDLVPASAHVTVTVTPIPVGSITIAASPSVAVGATVHATALLKSATGVPLLDPWYSVAWTASTTSGATTATVMVPNANDSRNADALGVAIGSSVLTATSLGVSGTAPISVTAAPIIPIAITTVTGPSNVAVGDTIRLTVKIVDILGNPLSLTGRRVTWYSNNGTIATVQTDSATLVGVVVGNKSGSVAITVAIDNTAGAKTVTVDGVATVTVATSAPRVLVGQTIRATATAKTANGTVVHLAGRSLIWQTFDTAKATVQKDNTTLEGVVTGVSAGTATVLAAVDGIIGSAQVIVDPLPITSAITTVAPTPVPGFAYALFDQPTNARYATAANTAFSSSGGAISVVRNSAGNYTVTLAGQATPTGLAQRIMVTAYRVTESKCKLGSSWNSNTGSLVANVRCFTTHGDAADIPFTIQLVGADATPAGTTTSRFLR